MNALNPMAVLAAVLGDDALDVADVFSTDLWTGNSATQSITNGLDMSGAGGLFWAKRRNISAAFHLLTDTERNALLFSNSTSAESSYGGFSITDFSFENDGVSFTATDSTLNLNTNFYVGWSFRKAPGFHDVVTWSGDSVGGREIPHSLGGVPGLIIVKNITSAVEWRCWHNSIPSDTNDTGLLVLNSTQESETNKTNIWAANGITDSYFTVSTTSPNNLNESGEDYVAYLFAHDTSDDGIIQCIPVTTDGSGNGSYAHGWAEGVQFVMLKASSTTGDWEMYDTARSPSWTTDLRLRANLSNAEDTVTRISDSGGTVSFSGLSASQTYVMLLIRGES